LVQIGPMASEELINMWKVNGRMDDRPKNATPPKKGGWWSTCLICQEQELLNK
jgi:hypothetical protein